MLKIRRFLEYKKCICCGNEFLIYEMTKINKQEYICNSCNNYNDYYTKNWTYKGKKKDISFSFEFETSSATKCLTELAKYNFIKCDDCTIGGYEWKSPIFYSKKAFHNICKKIGKFAKFVGDDCGTHLHISTPYKTLINRYRNEIFKPILNLMKQDREKTIKFWGRYFGDYCESEIFTGDRYNAFNTLSSVETIEFRLLKFVNSEQYIRASDFCIEITKLINNSINKRQLNTEEAEKIGKAIAEKYMEVISNV